MTHIGGCFSLALDGCFGSEDAALSEGYTNHPENKGFLAYSQEEVDNFCIRANRAGLQITMHAIGDAAVDQALNAYAAALKDYPRKDARHILIHGDLMNKAAIQKAAELGITIAVQPALSLPAVMPLAPFRIRSKVSISAAIIRIRPRR